MFDDYLDRLHITDDSVRIGKVAEADLLNGAQNWEQYSYGGCAEVYDGDICERLCTESEKKKTHGGELPLMGEEHDGNAPARTSERLVLRKKAQQHLLCFPSRRGLVLLQSHWPVGGHRGRDNALDERTRITTG